MEHRDRGCRFHRGAAVMRYRPVKKPAPMPENPYHRIFTPMPSFEDLVRKAREEEKMKKKLEIRNEQ